MGRQQRYIEDIKRTLTTKGSYDTKKRPEGAFSLECSTYAICAKSTSTE